MPPKKNNNLNIDNTLSNANKSNVDKSDTKYNSSIVYTGKGKKRKLELITPDRPFQQFIINEIISKPAEKRLVYWFYSKRGNIGKSAFCKWILMNYDTIFIEDGGKADIKARMVSNPNKLAVDNLVVLIDLPRADGNNVSYGIIDHIKIGIMSPTYVFNSPHVIIFSYALPKLDGLSIDRWRVYEIFDDYSFKYRPINIERWYRMHPRLVKPDPVDWAYEDCENFEFKMNMYSREREKNVSRPVLMGDSIFSSTSSDRGAAPLG